MNSAYKATADPHLVELIYEAAFIPEMWQSVLEGLCSKVSAWGAALIVVGQSKSVRFVPTATYSLLTRRFYELGASYENVRPARALARQHCGFLSDLDLCTRQELDSDPLYARILRPLGVGWTAGTAIPVPSGDLLIFDVCRAISLTPFDGIALSSLDAYRPHLARAALTAARLGLEKAKMAAGALGSVGLPAAVLGDGGRILAMNSLFEGLAPSVAAGARDRVVIQNRAADDLLKRSLAHLCLESEGIVQLVGSIPIPAYQDTSAIILHVIPIMRSAHDIFSGATSILIATPLSAALAPSGSVLSGLFDLTPAEARVAKGIIESKTVEDLARELSLSSQTIRSYLKAVLIKTGTHRQAELVGLLAGTRPLGASMPSA